MNHEKAKAAILFLLLFLSLGYAAPRHFRFKHFTTEHGLSASAVTCIAKDRKGFMWFGTYDGLDKFDGYEFQVYRNKRSEPRSISSNAILALFEDRSERLWVGTQTGRDRYDRGADAFVHFRYHSGMTLTVVDIKENANGEIIFFATDQVFTLILHVGLAIK